MIISFSNLLGQLILVEFGIGCLEIKVGCWNGGGAGVVHRSMSATTVTTTAAVVVGLQKMASHAGKTVGLVLHMLDRLSILGHVQFADLLGKDLDRLAELVGLGLGRSCWWRSRLDGFRIRLVLMNLVGLGSLGFGNLLLLFTTLVSQDYNVHGQEIQNLPSIRSE